jgi:hypothetical protein
MIKAALVGSLFHRPRKFQISASATISSNHMGGATADAFNAVVWFALNDDRPLFAFAGIWTTFAGDRGTKSKPISGPHLVYGFLTTAANAVVAPIYPKAMPVILTTWGGEGRSGGSIMKAVPFGAKAGYKLSTR